ncbi:MAG: hypothetical protein JW895_09240 [Thermoleophilaceae bacterium]|nr:hypothetical protein [Thermoleophilaceae bacterium]
MRGELRTSLSELERRFDSYRFHNSRHSREQDRRRDREARERGDELLRFTHGDILERPAAVIAGLEPRLRGASRTSGAPPARR